MVNWTLPTNTPDAMRVTRSVSGFRCPAAECAADLLEQARDNLRYSPMVRVLGQLTRERARAEAAAIASRNRWMR